ncbi:restriction endonuclease subunit S [Pseudomonas sp. MDT1-85]
MTGWPTVSLSDIAEKVDYGVTASAAKSPLGPKFLRITDIQNGGVNWDKVPWCECDERSISRSLLQPGDIVFARTGATTGKSYLVRDCPDNAVFASYLIRVRLNEEVDPAYLIHFFNTPYYWAQISSGARGAAQLGVNSTTLQALKVPKPTLSEQRRIAAILDQVEYLRTKRRATLEKIDSLSHAAFCEMFGNVLVNDRGWNDSKELGDCAEIVSGFTKGRKLDGKLTSSVPYLTVANVQDKFLKMDGVKTEEATDSEVERYRLLKGDLLLTEGGDPDKLGRGTLWNDELPVCIHQNHVFRVRLVTDELTPIFLNWLVGSVRGKRYFLKSAKQTTGIASINISQLKNFPLLIPPLALQKKFELSLMQIELTKTLQQKHLSELDALFSSLQHRAFRGEL